MGCLTKEHYKIAEKNGISRSALERRVKNYNWDIDKAITEKTNPKLSARNQKRTVFTKEQLEIAKKNGINRATLYSRVHKGMTPEEAISKAVRKKTEHDWEREVYALYKGDSLIADGTVFEIAEITQHRVEQLKYYAGQYYKRKSNDNRILLEYLGLDGEDDE